MDNAMQFNPDDFEKSRQREMDRTLLVKFFYKSVQDKKATLEQGRAIFAEKLYIDIRIPGERDSAVCRPATPHDIERFKEHHEAFIKRVTSPSEQGTPLAEWPLMTRSQVDELAFYNVKTVEQLATVSDASAQKFMGMNALRQKAKEWLEKNVEADVKTGELKEQLQQRDDVIAKLTARLEALEAKGTEPASEEALKPKTKARGRPRKVKENVVDGGTDINSQ